MSCVCLLSKLVTQFSCNVMLLSLVFLSSILSACGKYDGQGEYQSALLGDEDIGTGGDRVSNEASVAAFQQTLFPVMRDQCSDCHGGGGPGSPSLAHFDPATAHFSITQNQKVYLDDPVNSRVVQRLAVDLHYCWSVCTEDAEAVRSAVAAWAELIDFGAQGMDVEGIRSESQQLADGHEIDPANERYVENVIALYEFKEGSGEIARDTSGVLPALDLELENMHWISNWGIESISGENGLAIGAQSASRKLYDLIADSDLGSQQYSIEAWIVAANVSQEGPARIVSYSRGTGSRNFMMAQVQYNYDFRNRNLSEDTSENGTPSLSTEDDDRDLQANLQHAVLTYDPYKGRRIYVNGVFTEDYEELEASPLWNWDPTHRLVLGNETSRNRLWLGKLRYVAIHREALSDDQILQNYRAGVGRRVVVQFDISQWTGGIGVIEASVSELDAYSYVICEPTFVGATSNGIRLSNMRIVINGTAPVTGQAFRDLDVGVFDSSQLLSRGCTVVAKDLGPEDDVFSIEFEHLGRFQNLVEEPVPPTVPDSLMSASMPILGVRDFDRINNTMAAVTGVDPLADAVGRTFEELTQQLPADSDLRSFGSSQQVGISRLALDYCDLMIESPHLRENFFGRDPGFQFDQPVAIAFASQADTDQITGALVDRMMGTDLLDQPDATGVQAVLGQLMDQLNAICEGMGCGAERTRTVVKAACSAMLSSAIMTIH